MPKMLVFFIVFLAVFGTAGSLYAAAQSPKVLDLKQVVEAIRQVENWDGRSIGTSGEYGPWQFTKETWSDFSSKPFWWASSFARDCKAEQHRVAIAYVKWIADNLVHIPLRDSAYSIALVYTAGYGNVKHRTISRDKHDYARRVQNIYDQLTK